MVSAAPTGRSVAASSKFSTDLTLAASRHVPRGARQEGLSHSLEQPDTFVKLYGITGRIRLVATDPVLYAAEACIRQIIDLFAKPNMTVEQIRLVFERDRLDPLRNFSVACRKEFLAIAGN